MLQAHTEKSDADRCKRAIAVVLVAHLSIRQATRWLLPSVLGLVGAFSIRLRLRMRRLHGFLRFILDTDRADLYPRSLKIDGKHSLQMLVVL